MIHLLVWWGSFFLTFCILSTIVLVADVFDAVTPDSMLAIPIVGGICCATIFTLIAAISGA